MILYFMNSSVMQYPNYPKLETSHTDIMKTSSHKAISMFLRYNLVDEEDIKGMRCIERKTETDTKNIFAKIIA